MQQSFISKENSDVLRYLFNKCNTNQMLINKDYLSIIQNSLITPSQRQSLVYHLAIVSKLTNQLDLTFELAINYLDCFLSTKRLLNVKTLQLLGYLCLHIASEVQGSSIFSVEHIFSMTQNISNLELIKTMKLYLISALNWNFNLPSCTEIIFYLLDASVNSSMHSYILKKSEDYIENCLSNYDISRHGRFLIAIGIIYLIISKTERSYSQNWLACICRDFELIQPHVENLSLMIYQKSSQSILNN